jgi:hypothetical protein
MNLARLILITFVFSIPGRAPSETSLDLTGYQRSDGAITLQRDGNLVDPYFATKALIVARDAGLDISAPAKRWIAWLMPRQRADGRFDRYCWHPTAEWSPCAAEDADDAMLALWIQLLYSLSPLRGVPGEWISTLNAAESYLDTVRDPTMNIYLISRAQPVGLLMDNVEVYSALRLSSRARMLMGDTVTSARLASSASRLAIGIERIFRVHGSAQYRSSTQERKVTQFYPDVLAQIYPMLAGIDTNKGRSRRAFKRWLHLNRADWVSPTLDYPWGLVALAAAKMGDVATVAEWLDRARTLRHSRRWNVLEEAIYQSLAPRKRAAGAGISAGE